MENKTLAEISLVVLMNKIASDIGWFTIETGNISLTHLFIVVKSGDVIS